MSWLGIQWGRKRERLAVKDYQEELREHLNQEFTEYRNQVVIAAANMVRSAYREPSGNPIFDMGYKQAQVELAEMLNQVAKGQITSDTLGETIPAELQLKNVQK